MRFCNVSETLGLGYDSRYDGFDPQYPLPPRAHWLVLLLVWIAISSVLKRLVPERYNDLARSMMVDAWVFYLCHWIRRVNAEAKSPFWCDVYVIVQLIWAALSGFAHANTPLMILWSILTIGSLILGVGTIFMVKSDLEDHYNNREHAGLVLNGLMTFAFNFLYFQHHLYDIAKRKQRAQSFAGGQLS